MLGVLLFYFCFRRIFKLKFGLKDKNGKVLKEFNESDMEILFTNVNGNLNEAWIIVQYRKDSERRMNQ